MSVTYCPVHDRTVDTDFEVDGCVKCERSGSWDADVELAESMFTFAEPAVSKSSLVLEDDAR